VSFISKIGSALGKLLIVACLAVAFLFGMTYVVYRSLQGSEITVPEIVGKNYNESEKELEALGLKIKRRADRYSEEAPNTVLEQLPKPGDTVKTGQLILVVTSKPNPEGDEKPTTLKKGNTSSEEDDTEKIEELISDKPKKKSNSNTNTSKKKAVSTRDVLKTTRIQIRILRTAIRVRPIRTIIRPRTIKTVQLHRQKLRIHREPRSRQPIKLRLRVEIRARVVINKAHRKGNRNIFLCNKRESKNTLCVNHRF